MGRPASPITPRTIWAVVSVAFVLIIITLSISGTGQRSPLLRDSMGRGSGSIRTTYCEPPLFGSEGGQQHIAGQQLSLVQVQVLIRHGDRSAIHSLSEATPVVGWCHPMPALLQYIKQLRLEILGGSSMSQEEAYAQLKVDYMKDKSECYPGQLTDRGILQQVATGKYLAEAYADLSLKSPEEVYFRSTFYPRTVASGSAFLLGFAPLVRGITLHTEPDNSQEHLFGVGLHGASRGKGQDPRESKERGYCQRSVDLAAEQERAFVVSKDTQAIIDTLGPRAQRYSVADLTDPLLASVCHSEDLNLLSPSDLVQLKREADRMYCDRYTGAKGGRSATLLSMQPFLSEVMGHFKNRLEGRSTLKFVLYTAHDTVVAPVLAALQAFDCRWPPYASRVVWELWEDTNNKRAFIRMLYNGRPIQKEHLQCSEETATTYPDSMVTLACFEQYVEQGLLRPFKTIEEACKPAS